MANRKPGKQQDLNQEHVKRDRDRKGDSARTSNEGRKEASGGRTDTNNRGQVKTGGEKL